MNEKKVIYYCSTCKHVFDKPDINEIEVDGEIETYPMCNSCNGWNITKIEYESEEELYTIIRGL